LKRLKLKHKLLFNALGIALLLMAVSTIVVSVIIDRQNRTTVKQDLVKTINIVRSELMKKKEKLVADTHQMVTMNKLSDDFQFIVELGKNQGLTVTRSSYEKIADVVFQAVVTGNLTEMSAYDIEGKLMAYAMDNGQGGYLMGFHHTNPESEFVFTTKEKGLEAEIQQWESSKDLDAVSLNAKVENPIPTTPRTFFQTIGGFVCIQSQVPVIARQFSLKSNKMEQRQFGFIRSTYKLDKQLASGISEFTGMKINFFDGDKISVGGLEAYESLEAPFDDLSEDPTPFMEQKIIFNDIHVQGNGYFEATVPLYYGKKYVGAIAAFESKALVFANTKQIAYTLVLVYLVCMVLIIPLVYWFSTSYSKPIKEVAFRLRDIAEGEGDLTLRLQETRSDEIGELAHWFNVFIEKLHVIVMEISENTKTLNEASIEMSEMSELMSAGIQNMFMQSESVSTTANEMSANMDGVAENMDESSSNMSLVAAAAEQMTSTINEIAQNSETGNTITEQAVSQARQTSLQIEQLVGATKEIGNVTETITEISDQTNLLALNATIEAARAGEAGKGFAVVANEIKELARQTAEATDEIKQKIAGIQQSTEGSIKEIEQITAIIHQVNESVSVIGGAVEEQSIATKEIAGNVAMASQKMQLVNESIGDSSQMANDIASHISMVNITSSDIAESSTGVYARARGLSDLAEKLDQLINRFKV